MKCFNPPFSTAWIGTVFVAYLSLGLCGCAGPGQAPRAAASTGPHPIPAESQPSADSTPHEAASAPRRFVPTPWTDEFMERAVLLADRITVEGPAGLVEHCVMTLDDSLFSREEISVPGGVDQVLRPHPGIPAHTVLRAQLDAWQLAAFQELRISLRPAAPDVTVTARGDAVWQHTNGEEMRAKVWSRRAVLRPGER